MPYADPVKKKEYDRKWKLKHPDHIKKCNKEWRLKNSDYIKEYNKKWLENHPEYKIRWKSSGGMRAAIVVRDAIKQGRLKSLSKNFIECYLCQDRATCYDHRDYNKPLEVQAVCRSCNGKLGKGIHLNE